MLCCVVFILHYMVNGAENRKSSNQHEKFKCKINEFHSIFSHLVLSLEQTPLIRLFIFFVLWIAIGGVLQWNKYKWIKIDKFTMNLGINVVYLDNNNNKSIWLFWRRGASTSMLTIIQCGLFYAVFAFFFCVCLCVQCYCSRPFNQLTWKWKYARGGAKNVYVYD